MKVETKKDERVAVLATAELPAKSVDLAAINLTELVNGMLNSALKGTKKFFSLLSITSYSSYAFHKVSIVVYNISNLKNVDPTKFPTRYCYCLNNRTNDLTDFTALLVDIIGNSTSFLTEIFKSTSILSVSHSNDTDCIYICVMSGRTGRNLSDLWEAVEKSPVINYTFSGNVSDLLDLDSILPSLIPLREDAEKVLSETAQGMWTFKTTKMPMRTQTGASKGGEMLLTQHPMWLRTMSLKGAEGPSIHAALWLQTDVLKGPDVSSTKTASVEPPSPTTVEDDNISSRAPPVPTPKMSVEPWTIGPKGDETISPKFSTWRKTVSLKSTAPSSFQASSLLQAGVSIEWEVSATKVMLSPAPVTSYDILTGTQPFPTTGVPLPLVSPSTEQGQDLLKTFLPLTEASVIVTQPTSSKTTRASFPMQTGNWALLALSTPPKRPGVFQKVHSRCPQAPKRDTVLTLPAATAVAPKINPCVMELCKFFQQCLCMRDRRYSREETMRYCIENYSWFLKNAAYVCDKVKRMSYSNTLKQKCLTSICKSI
ncbi:HERV-H LTR-associating protein 1 [Eublepharis macularius]|uniref:HERV-H LTR-associating protein 1 n=1 Tax=Eublepharis macularius TaxID=481883 RepID=A0AA97L461_EUBMA|nr:HERV-H LTR-associating protein 1 [Eublepharis macularius]